MFEIWKNKCQGSAADLMMSSKSVSSETVSKWDGEHEVFGGGLKGRFCYYWCLNDSSFQFKLLFLTSGKRVKMWFRLIKAVSATAAAWMLFQLWKRVVNRIVVFSSFQVETAWLRNHQTYGRGRPRPRHEAFLLWCVHTIAQRHRHRHRYGSSCCCCRWWWRRCEER